MNYINGKIKHPIITRILIIKTFVLSKLLYPATVFPPNEQTKKINKIAVNFI